MVTLGVSLSGSCIDGMLTFDPVLIWRSGVFGEAGTPGEGGEPFGRKRQLEDPLRRILVR